MQGTGRMIVSVADGVGAGLVAVGTRRSRHRTRCAEVRRAGDDRGNGGMRVFVRAVSSLVV